MNLTSLRLDHTIPAPVRRALDTVASRPIIRTSHNRNVGSVKLPAQYRLIVDMHTRTALELCSHERYNRTLDRWCARIP